MIHARPRPNVRFIDLHGPTIDDRQATRSRASLSDYLISCGITGALLGLVAYILLG